MENAPVTIRSQGLLVIAADGEVTAFRDAGMAASYVEAVDVRGGEYEAFSRLAVTSCSPPSDPTTRSGLS
jgi:hypothetical protein